MEFGEDIWKEIKRKEREALQVRKKRKQKARQAANKHLQQLKKSGKYKKAKTPKQYHSAHKTIKCKETDCQNMIETNRTYCCDQCRIKHKTKRHEARKRLVSLYKYQIDNGYYQMPSAERVADAIMDGATTGHTTYGPRMRFNSKSYLRSREWAEYILRQVEGNK